MMNFQKIALILKDEVSSWKSCQLITSNLHEVYRTGFAQSDVKEFRVSKNYNHYLSQKTAQALKEWGAETIVWMDHKPNAALLLKALDDLYLDSSATKPVFVIHLFGDFVLDCLGWESVKDSLQRYPVHFIVASDRQKQLVESFFSGCGSIVSVSPFPVNGDAFNMDNFQQNRESLRSEFGIAPEDKILLYTGRISYQKNVELLVNMFKTLEPVFPGKIHLWIAGTWDDILVPYSGKIGTSGSFYSQFSKTIKKISNSNIKFLGHLDEEQLPRFYQASDLFVSFSTYNDEDYGMSVAEALMCGLPCVLSNWGGFSSFKNYSDQVELTPVYFNLSRPLVEINYARKVLMQKILTLSTDQEVRIKNALKASQSLSVKMQAKILKESFSKRKFGSIDNFTSKFYKLCIHSRNNPGAPFKDRNLELSPFYKEVYGEYGS
jgi:glycosyltransferase involved in cell wall biosynthesis